MSSGVKIPASTPYVGWVCYSFSPLHREVFLRVLRFFPILKNQHFEILIRSGRTRTRFNKLLRTPKCSVGKQIIITITKKYFALQYLSFLLRLTPASFPVLGEFGFVWAIGFGSKPPRLFGQREWDNCTMTPFYYSYQNPWVCCFQGQIKAIVLLSSAELENLNNKAKTKWILVVVVKYRHRAIVLLASGQEIRATVRDLFAVQ